MKKLALITIGSLCLFTYSIIAFNSDQWCVNGDCINKTEPEYILEILNQDSVQIYSPSTNITYKCKMNEVDKVLIKDNL